LARPLPHFLTIFKESKIRQFINITKQEIPGKLRARPVQQPATPALMTADTKQFTSTVEDQ